MRELSLFTGGGGGVWASRQLGHRIVGYVEINRYAQQVLSTRIQEGWFTVWSEPEPCVGGMADGLASWSPIAGDAPNRRSLAIASRG